MNEVVIEAVDLAKIYRLYTRPHYRFLDMFGLLRKKEGRYTEHAALAGITLRICRGEKVGIIGRNGAGKSTFLKMVTKTIEPTSGSIKTYGQVHALLQIGTGFHPDFTGRENVFSYLANLGITGKKAERRFQEILEFAELEEYIDQPVKTYSTGMGMRLMFATSTAIDPDILVLDEVLGVGDAYFARKSFERMEQMCTKNKTTLLLVSHDIYSVAKFCERMIWIDHGKMIIDSNSQNVLKAYEDSVRIQEESRQRKINEQRLKAIIPAEKEFLTLELSTPNNQPLNEPIFFSQIKIKASKDEEASIPLFNEKNKSRNTSHLNFDHGCWGSSIQIGNRMVRPMLNHGSSFHKVCATFVVPKDSVFTDINKISLEIFYCSSPPDRLCAKLFFKGESHEMGLLEPSNREWKAATLVPKKNEKNSFASAINPSGIYGTGHISINDIRLLNEKNEQVFKFHHGKKITLRIDYKIKDRSIPRNAQVLVAFHRDGVTDLLRCIARCMPLNEKEKTNGTIFMEIEKLNLGCGVFTISIMVAKENYYDVEQTVYFSINPGVYTCLARALEIEIQSDDHVAKGTGFVAEANWKVEYE